MTKSRQQWFPKPSHSAVCAMQASVFCYEPRANKSNSEVAINMKVKYCPFIKKKLNFC